MVLLTGGLAVNAQNLALNKPVTLNGSFFTGGWGSGLTVLANTVTDGTFLPRSTQWDQGAVWWDTGNATAPQNMVIDLGGPVTINSLIVQGDDNDGYLVEYYDGSSWQTAWDVPAVGGWGMQTRPDPTDDTAAYTLPSPITASELRISGVGGDSLYSISEVQAFGSSVPEAASTAPLLFGACSGLMLLARRFRKN